MKRNHLDKPARPATRPVFWVLLAITALLKTAIASDSSPSTEPTVAAATPVSQSAN